MAPKKPGVKVPKEFNAKMMTSAKGKPKAGTISATRKPAAKPAAPRGITMSGDKQAAIKGASNPAGPRAPKPSWDQKGNLKRPALPSAGQTSGNRTATRIQGMRNRIIANTAAGKPSGVRTGQPANIKGALPAAGKTGGSAAPKGTTVPQRGGFTRGVVKAAANVGKAGARAALGRALVVGDIASVLNDNLNPNSEMNKRDAELLRRINKPSKYGPRFKNANTGASAAKGAKPAAGTSRFAGARDKAMAKAKAIKGSPVVGPKAASAPARMSAPAARSSAPSAPKATAPKASAPKASAPSGPARMSASTYNRMSGNYGTNRTNNPLMADFKDSLPSKAAEPDVGYSPKTKVSSESIKGAPTDVTKLAFSNPKLSAERTRKIKRG